MSVDTGPGGGDQDRKIPVHHNPITQAANKVGPSNFRNTATYVNGMIGGVLMSKLGYSFKGDRELIKSALDSGIENEVG